MPTNSLSEIVAALRSPSLAMFAATALVLYKGESIGWTRYLGTLMIAFLFGHIVSGYAESQNVPQFMADLILFISSINIGGILLIITEKGFIKALITRFTK